MVRVLSAVVLVSGAAAPGAEPSFTVADQRDASWSSTEVFKASVVLISGTRRNTGEFVKAWVQALPATTRVFGLANLSTLPFFIPRGLVRSDLRAKLPATSLLCDWTGAAATALKVPEANAVRVYGPGAVLLLELKEAPSPAGVARVRSALLQVSGDGGTAP